MPGILIVTPNDASTGNKLQGIKVISVVFARDRVKFEKILLNKYTAVGVIKKSDKKPSTGNKTIILLRGGHILSENNRA